MQPGSVQQNRVVDLTAYRSAKRAEDDIEPFKEDDAALRAIEEIAHHLLMAVRVIKKLHQ